MGSAAAIKSKHVRPFVLLSVIVSIVEIYWSVKLVWYLAFIMFLRLTYCAALETKSILWKLQDRKLKTNPLIIIIYRYKYSFASIYICVRASLSIPQFPRVLNTNESFKSNFLTRQKCIVKNAIDLFLIVI